MNDELVPELSVVIPSVNGWGDLEGCLAALRAQTGNHRLEIIVADRVGEPIRKKVEAKEAIVLIEASADSTIPELRALAFDIARADLVAVIEDHVVVPPEWAGKMLAAQAAGDGVVGGSVKNLAEGTLVDIAAFICEYSHCLAPPSGPSEWVVGNNVTYRRELLVEFKETIAEHKWENHLHDAFSSKGIVLLSRPEIEVGHKKHYTVGEYTAQRYLYSRSYAGMRVAGAGRGRRFLYGLAAFALPPLLLQRLITRVWKTGTYRRELVASLPLQALFMTSWAVGEIIGYWFGPGQALRKVR